MTNVDNANNTTEFLSRIRVLNHVFVMNVAVIQTISFCIGYHILKAKLTRLVLLGVGHDLPQ